MRKIFTFLCAILMIAVLTLQADAASSVSASLSVSKKTVNSGDKVTVTVSAKVDSCGSGGIELSFDSSVFELSSGEWVLSGAFMKDFSKSSKDGVFAFDSASKISGKVFKFVLKVKSNAPIGKSNVTVKFKADSKSVSKTVAITVACDHTYSDTCDTTCNKCGAKRKITHTWDAGTAIKEATCTSAGSANYKCKVCGETKTETVAKTAHQYDNACDTSCNVCNASREITHAYAWTCDQTEHWQACKVCGEAQEKAAHSMATTVTGNAQGHGYACSVCLLIPDAQPHAFDSACDANCEDCGYVRSVTHIYSERYSYDKEGHWFACVLCDEALEKVAHIPGEAATEDTDQVCTQCGYIIATSVNHVHTMGSDWLSDEAGHWYECRCGALIDSVPHTWDAGVLNDKNGIITYTCSVCQATEHEVFVPETEPVVEEEEEPQQPMYKNIPLWMLLAAGLGISVIVNLILLISVIVLRVRIKRNGRY